jgi:hypothetical protein
MNGITRRETLKFGLLGCATLLAGCGGSDEASVATPSQPAPAPPTAQDWSVNLPVFLVGSGASFDLSATLPSGVTKGGTFSLAPNSAPLPAGMTLSTAGILSVGTAVSGQTAGLMFAYAAPAT